MGPISRQVITRSPLWIEVGNATHKYIRQIAASLHVSYQDDETTGRVNYVMFESMPNRDLGYSDAPYLWKLSRGNIILTTCDGNCTRKIGQNLEFDYRTINVKVYWQKSRSYGSKKYRVDTENLETPGVRQSSSEASKLINFAHTTPHLRSTL